MDKHTPTPWFIQTKQDENGLVQILHNHCAIAHEVTPVNAAFIVRAVNAHEELLAHLKAASARLKEFGGIRLEGKKVSVDFTSDLDAAIAKAEGK